MSHLFSVSVVAPNLDAVAVTTFRLRVTLSFLLLSLQSSIAKSVLLRTSLSWTFFQASSIKKEAAALSMPRLVLSSY